jgi:3-hydroxyisobutyrate dehydrogenase
VRVAFLGLGHLGGTLCDHAIAGGHDITVFDPDPTVVAPRVAAGARAAASPAAAARDAVIVCVVVRDDEQALEAIAGDDGVLQTLGGDGVVVLHSTVAPATVRELYERCQARGVRFVDVAIGAGVGRETGEMFAMCGGDPDTIERVRPVVSCYAKHIVRFGDLGAGMAAKLARNLIQYSMWAVIHEGMELAMAAGIDREAFAHLFRESGVTASHDMILDQPERDPVQLEKTVRLAWKDLDDAFALAGEHAVATPLGREAQRKVGPSVGSPLVPPG